jgi:inosine triphosphate pyrophosphatase
MEDQKLLLQRMGISVCCLNSTENNSHNVINEIVEGEYLIVYMTPEYAIKAAPNDIIIIEDTALGFASFNGLPGPYIKDFLKLGLVNLVRTLDSFGDKSATATCSAIVVKNKEYKVFVGEINGHIVEPKGVTGFGWDPIFVPNCDDNLSQQTFAEMQSDVKNKISHRYNAFKQVKQYLEKLF